MRPIPNKIRKQFKQEKCLVCDSIGNEKHHALIYSGRQINETFAIISLCTRCHRGDNGTIFKRAKDLSEMKAIEKGLNELIIKYPKFDWNQRLIYLKKQYGDIS